MGSSDVTETLDRALAVTGVDQIQVRHRPRLLSDNGPAYVSGELRESLTERGMGPLYVQLAMADCGYDHLTDQRLVHLLDRTTGAELVS